MKSDFIIFFEPIPSKPSSSSISCTFKSFLTVGNQGRESQFQAEKCKSETLSWASLKSSTSPPDSLPSSASISTSISGKKDWTHTQINFKKHTRVIFSHWLSVKWSPLILAKIKKYVFRCDGNRERILSSSCKILFLNQFSFRDNVFFLLLNCCVLVFFLGCFLSS